LRDSAGFLTLLDGNLTTAGHGKSPNFIQENKQRDIPSLISYSRHWQSDESVSALLLNFPD
jgi:hypothetical protein